MKARTAVLALVALVGVSLLLGAGFVILRGSDHASAAVEIREDGVPLRTASSPADAIEQLSRVVGFPVGAPSRLPDPRLRLTVVDAALGPPGVPSAIKTATLDYVVAGAAGNELTLRIEQVAGPLREPPSPARPLQTGRKDMSVFVQTEAPGVVSGRTPGEAMGIWVIMEGRSYVMTIMGKALPPESTIIDMVVSLP